MRGNDEVEGEDRPKVHSRTGIAIGHFVSAAIHDDLGLRRPAYPGAFALLGTSVATAELGAEFIPGTGSDERRCAFFPTSVGA